MDLSAVAERLAGHPLVADISLTVGDDGLVTASVVPLDPFHVPRLRDLLAYLDPDTPAEMRPRRLVLRTR